MIFKADIAREFSEKNRKEKIEEEFKTIERDICIAVSEGRFSVSYENIFQEHRRILKDLGYKVYEDYQEDCVTISWRKD